MTPPVIYNIQGIGNVRPTVIYLYDNDTSGFRAATEDDFASNLNLSGDLSLNVGAVSITSGFITVTNPVTQVGITGDTSVSINNWPGNQYVEVTNWPDNVRYPGDWAGVGKYLASGENQQFVDYNQWRRGLYIYNQADKELYIKLGSTASTNDFSFIIEASGYYEMPRLYFLGSIHGIWPSGANGFAMVTDIVVD